MKKFIFIPVVNRFDLLEKAVRSVKQDIYDEYIIVNNSGSEIPDEVYSGTKFRVLNPEKSMSFKDTQNAMMSYAVDNGYDFYSFMHNDGEIHDDTDRELVRYAEECSDNWAVIFTNYDVLCAFKTKAVDEIGVWGDYDWPEQKNGYLLDNDYYRRVRSFGYAIKELTDREITYTPLDRVGGVSHVGSATLKEGNEQEIWDSQVQSVYDHYVLKWGGHPGQEKYTHAYNKYAGYVTDFPNWFHGMKDNFDSILSEYSNKEDARFLEIGSFTGDASYYMLKNILLGSGATLTCVDTWGGSVEHTGDLKDSFDTGDIEKEFDRKTKYYLDKVIKHKTTSTDFLLKNRDKEYDFIYVDGDHYAKTIISDAVLAWDNLKVGGIMGFDDYEWTHPEGSRYAPKIAIDAFVSIYEPYIDIIHKGYQLWVRKIA